MCIEESVSLTDLIQIVYNIYRIYTGLYRIIQDCIGLYRIIQRFYTILYNCIQNFRTNFTCTYETNRRKSFILVIFLFIFWISKKSIVYKYTQFTKKYPVQGFQKSRALRQVVSDTSFLSPAIMKQKSSKIIYSSHLFIHLKIQKNQKFTNLPSLQKISSLRFPKLQSTWASNPGYLLPLPCNYETKSSEIIYSSQFFIHISNSKESKIYKYSKLSITRTVITRNIAQLAQLSQTFPSFPHSKNIVYLEIPQTRTIFSGPQCYMQSSLYNNDNDNDLFSIQRFT